MAKKHKPAQGRDEARAPGAERDPELGLDPTVVQQGAVGNQALQDKISGQERGTPQVSDPDLARDTAFPLVERALIALQMLPRPQADVDRFVQILERSHLPEERRALLVDKVRSDQAAALGAQRAVERAFGADGTALRSGLIDTLDAVWAGLQAGRAEGASWVVPERAPVPLGDVAADSEAATGVRAEALVRDLAAGMVAPELVGERDPGAVADAVQAFCRDAQVLILWDEEEEEEAHEPGDYAQEESGS